MPVSGQPRTRLARGARMRPSRRTRGARKLEDTLGGVLSGGRMPKVHPRSIVRWPALIPASQHTRLRGQRRADGPHPGPGGPGRPGTPGHPCRPDTAALRAGRGRAWRYRASRSRHGVTRSACLMCDDARHGRGSAHRRNPRLHRLVARDVARTKRDRRLEERAPKIAPRLRQMATPGRLGYLS